MTPTNPELQFVGADKDQPRAPVSTHERIRDKGKAAPWAIAVPRVGPGEKLASYQDPPAPYRQSAQESSALETPGEAAKSPASSQAAFSANPAYLDPPAPYRFSRSNKNSRDGKDSSGEITSPYEKDSRDGKDRQPPPASCPILRDSARIVELSNDMAKTIRRLKRNLRLCQDCPSGGDCPVLDKFSQLVNQAIEEIIEEWDLAAAEEFYG
jgi:hypothetical protein